MAQLLPSTEVLMHPEEAAVQLLVPTDTVAVMARPCKKELVELAAAL